MARPRRPTANSRDGFSAIELLFVAAAIVTVGGIAVPPLVGAVEDYRAAGAARFLSARLQRARMEAVLRSRDVALRFTAVDGRYAFATFADGNGNGVLARDIERGIDRPLGEEERLGDSFRGVDLGTLPGLPAVDAGSPAPGDDPVRLGASDGVTFTAAGSSSSGSLYVRGRGQRQFVVRIFGDTGKTRVLRFDATHRIWRPL